jgi:hypothetical protein
MTAILPATRSATGLRLLAHHDLGGHGDGMQVLREGDALYVGHTGTTGMGTSILDVSDPAGPPGAGHPVARTSPVTYA